MYARGVVHRDLKPENILLVSKNDDTSLKIADYGYATQLRPGKPLRTICGTPGYMAPEIIRGYLEGRAKYGGKSDVYSIGVVIYVMLSGTMPYDVSGFNKNHELMNR